MDPLSRQGQRLLQVGVAMLLFTSFEGFAIPYLASPPLGLSVHRLGALHGVLLPLFGLLWPRLRFGDVVGRVAFWCLLYSALSIDLAYAMGAVWGAGSETMHQAAGSAHGSAAQELAIMIVAYSSAPAGIVSFILIFWGLRIGERDSTDAKTR